MVCTALYRPIHSARIQARTCTPIVFVYNPPTIIRQHCSPPPNLSSTMSTSTACNFMPNGFSCCGHSGCNNCTQNWHDCPPLPSSTSTCKHSTWQYVAVHLHLCTLHHVSNPTYLSSQQLQQDLQVATDEYNTAASSHKQLIQQLLDLHKQHVAHIEQRACAQITQLLDAFSMYVCVCGWVVTLNMFHWAITTFPIFHLNTSSSYLLLPPYKHSDHTTREKRLGTYIPIMQHILHAARAHYTQQQRHATLTAENAMQGLQNAAADALTTVDLGYQERMRVLQGAYDDLQRGFDVKYGQQVQQAAILERQDAEMRQQVGVLGRVLSGLNATAARWRAKVWRDLGVGEWVFLYHMVLRDCLCVFLCIIIFCLCVCICDMYSHNTHRVHAFWFHLTATHPSSSSPPPFIIPILTHPSSPSLSHTVITPVNGLGGTEWSPCS